MQNWYHFHWLSGDRTSQQLIHSLDRCDWDAKAPIEPGPDGRYPTAMPAVTKFA